MLTPVCLLRKRERKEAKRRVIRNRRQRSAGAVPGYGLPSPLPDLGFLMGLTQMWNRRRFWR